MNNKLLLMYSIYEIFVLGVLWYLCKYKFIVSQDTMVQTLIIVYFLLDVKYILILIFNKLKEK